VRVDRKSLYRTLGFAELLAAGVETRLVPLIHHLTLGLGFIMKSVKLDMAADFAEIDNEFLMSFIYQVK